LTRDDRIFLTRETAKMTENSYDPYKASLRKKEGMFYLKMQTVSKIVLYSVCGG